MSTIAIYCGSFNPFHIGHEFVAVKALEMFDEVIVAIGINPDKYSDIDAQRFEQVQKALSGTGIKVESYNTLITEFIQSKKKHSEDKIVLVRGLRNGKDFDYEIEQIRYIEDVIPNINVVMIPCSRFLTHVSSSMIKTIQKFDSEKASRYLA